MLSRSSLNPRGISAPRLAFSVASWSELPWTAWINLLFFAVLLGTTVSAHSPDEVRDQVFSPIVPVRILTLGRTGARVGALLLVVYSLYLTVRSPRWWPAAKLLFPFLFFAGAGVLSVLWSPLPKVSLIQSVTFGTLMLWAWFIAVSWDSEIDTSRMLSQMVVLLGVAACGLVGLYFIKPDVGALIKGAPGIFHSTAAGAMSSLAVYLTIAGWLIWKWRWAYWSMLFIPAHIACILIGGNRVSVAAVFCAAGLLFCLIAPRRQLAWLAAVGSVLTLVYFTADPGLIMIDRGLSVVAERASQGQSVQQLKDLSGRADMWAAMWESFQESPIWGHGYGVTSPTGEIFMWGDWGNWTAHNLLLQSLTTMGILGAACLTIGVFLLGWNLLVAPGQLFRKDSKHGLLVMGIALWFAVWGLSNETFLGPMQPESLVFAMAVGIAAAAGLSRSRLEGSARARAYTSNPFSR